MSEELTVKEAANYKGVSDQAIHRAIKEGRLAARVELPPMSAHGVWKIQREDLEAWRPAMTPQERGRLGGRPRKGKDRG